MRICNLNKRTKTYREYLKMPDLAKAKECQLVFVESKNALKITYIAFRLNDKATAIISNTQESVQTSLNVHTEPQICWQFEISNRCGGAHGFFGRAATQENTNTQTHWHAVACVRRRSACTHTPTHCFAQAVQFRVYINSCTPFMFVSLLKLMWYRRHWWAYNFCSEWVFLLSLASKKNQIRSNSIRLIRICSWKKVRNQINTINLLPIYCVCIRFYSETKWVCFYQIKAVHIHSGNWHKKSWNSREIFFNVFMNHLGNFVTCKAIRRKRVCVGKNKTSLNNISLAFCQNHMECVLIILFALEFSRLD